MPSINHPTPPGFLRRRTKKGRLVFEPKSAARAVHVMFLEDLGEVKFFNQFECVKAHMSNRFFLKLDIENAFDSVDAFKADVQLDIDFGDTWMYFFHKKGGLIQGAPASPIIFHLYCSVVLDPHMKEWCDLNGLVYTRYVDDILISAPRTSKEKLDQFGKKKRKIIRNIIRDAGFSINEDKAVLVDNKYTPVIFLGMEIFKNRVWTEPEFAEKLAHEKPGTKRYIGLNAWGKKVIALNK